MLNWRLWKKVKSTAGRNPYSTFLKIMHSPITLAVPSATRKAFARDGEKKNTSIQRSGMMLLVDIEAGMIPKTSWTNSWTD